jgi:hypothetical protein
MERKRNSKSFHQGATMWLRQSILAIMFISLIFPFPDCFAKQKGEAVDVVPFGELKKWSAEGKDFGVIFEDSRDIFSVVVKFAEPHNLPEPGNIRLEYWQSTWPKYRIPRNKPSGAGYSGWLNVGDWFQGKWLEADTNLVVNDTTYTFTFNPLSKKEFIDLKDFPATYRSTLKLRVVANNPLPKIDSFAAYTDSTWDTLDFEIEWGGTAKEQAQAWDGRLEIFNGMLKQLQPISSASEVKTTSAHNWISKVHNKTDGIRAAILYAKTDAYNSFDETIVTIRTVCETFSFAIPDLIKYGHIFIPDFGVIIRKTDDNTTYQSAEQTWKSNQDKNIYRRVSKLPEQTFPHAWGSIPKKEPFYLPLGFDGGRQYFRVGPDGAVDLRLRWLKRIPGKDTKRCLYDSDSIKYSFGLSNAKLVERGLIDGCLPIIVAQWERDSVLYRQTAFVIPFNGVPPGDGRIYADDTLVLMSRFEISAAEKTECQAKLDIKVEAGGSEPLTINEGMIFVTSSDPKRLRMFVTSKDPIGSYSLQAQDKSIAYRANLTPQESKRILDISIPFITLTSNKEWQKVATIKFEGAYEAIREYWQKQLAKGTKITTPEPMINDFYKAHVSHLLLNTDREVGLSDRYVARVGTFKYGAFSNESCMMISDLDRRGYHKRAEQALNTWLYYQGTVGLGGDYSTNEGVFYGAGGYEDGGYNQHHGFVLWCLGEHYWYTRNTGWLRNAAPKIIKGCNWIINQRKRTILEAFTDSSGGIRAIEKGLMPPGSLEDIKDWKSWLSTNVYSWWGMKNAAAALDDAGIPEGKRLLEEAAAYREDILSAFTEAMQRSPVVRLRDGACIPHIPPEVHRRGRTFGWITETLEGAIHLICTGLLELWDRRATWIIKDYEDNLYISDQYGYNITGDDFDRYWFSRGGISMQANLLCNPIAYLWRDEPKHFLRAYFNAFAVSYWPDTRMMTEHALPNIGDHWGDHYKSSDEANSTCWLRMMFIQERGDELWLGAAIPRYWLSEGNKIGIENAVTYFGSMSVRFESEVNMSKIEMIFDPPRRNPPEKIYARFRHPNGKKITRCELNGITYTNFNSEKEYVILDKCPKTTTRITVHYN